MIFLMKQWRLKSHYYGGYVVQKKVGKQWQEPSYFNTLAQAAVWLLEQRVHHESTDLIIDCTDAAQSAIAQTNLVKLIEGICDEILEVLR